MPNYLNVAVMLAATIAAFVVLARLANHARTGRLLPSWRRRSPGSPADMSLVTLEEACAIDSKRRLVSVRCGGDRVFILTGGPADLVISRHPLHATQGGRA